MLRRWGWLMLAWGLVTGAALAGGEAKNAFDSLYGQKLQQVRATRETADDLTLAREMLDAATLAKSEPAMLKLLCETACDLAAGGRDYDLAATALETLAAGAPELKAACDEKVQAVREQQYAHAAGADKKRVAVVLVSLYLAAADAQAAARDYDAALASARKAYRLASATMPRSRKDVADRIAFLTGRKKLLDEAATMQAGLKANPANASLRNRLVRLLVLELDDPNAAVPYVAGADEALKTYVPLAARPVGAVPPAVCSELAAWYRHEASDLKGTARAICFGRAAVYIQRHLTEANPEGIQRVQAELMKKQIREELAKLGPVSGASMVVLPTLDLKHKVGLIAELDLKAAVQRVCFPPEGPLAVAAIEGGLAVFDLEKGKLARAIKLPQKATKLAISPNGQQVAVGLDAGRDESLVQAWSLLDGRLLTRAKPKGGKLLGVGWWEDKPVAARVVETGRQAAIVFWRVLDDAPAATVTLPNPWCHVAAWSNDFQRMVLLTGRSVDVYALKTGKLACSLKWENQWNDPFHAVMTPDGRTVIVGQKQGAPVFDLNTGKLIVTCVTSTTTDTRGHAVRGVSLSADGRRAAINTEHLVTLILDARTGKVLTKLTPHKALCDLSLSPDGRFLLTGAETTLKLWGIP